MSDIDHEKGNGDNKPQHPMNEVEVSEDELAANIQVAGPIPIASWLIIVSKYYEIRVQQTILKRYRTAY